MLPRTLELDYDARREPETDRFCIKCQKDLKPGQPARTVYLESGGGPSVLVHPEDIALVPVDSWLLGMDCAKQIGLEWSVPEAKG